MYSNLTPPVPETVQSSWETEEQFDLISLDNASMVLGEKNNGKGMWHLGEQAFVGKR